MGAPWTLLVYMINKYSPKKELIKDFFKDEFLINRIFNNFREILKVTYRAPNKKWSNNNTNF